MHFQNVAFRAMQPGDDDDVITDIHPLQAASKSREDLENRIRRALPALTWGIASMFDLRPNETDWINQV